MKARQEILKVGKVMVRKEMGGRDMDGFGQAQQLLSGLHGYKLVKGYSTRQDQRTHLACYNFPFSLLIVR